RLRPGSDGRAPATAVLEPDRGGRDAGRRRRPLRLAMGSGPRNISTAMMRAWENRGDCAVVDEPLYAHYLEHTGLDHPGREAVVASGEPDWRKVAARLVGPVPQGKAIWYQKHMTHHLLPHIGRDWLRELTHGFLIRH